MIGEKMAKLEDALLNAGVQSTQIVSFMSQIRITPRLSRNGDGITVASLVYQANIEIEHCNLSAAHVAACVSIFIAEHDCDRHQYSLEDPTIDVDAAGPLDADLLITLPFRELVSLLPDDSGSFYIGGDRFSVGVEQVTDVESIAVGDDQAIPTDLPVEADA